MMNLSEQQLLEFTLKKTEELMKAKFEMLALKDCRSKSDIAQEYYVHALSKFDSELKVLREQLIILGEKIMKDLSFMNKLCNPDYRPVSAIINAPFKLRDGDKIMSIATEGHALTGIYQDSDYPELPDIERLKVIKVITPTKPHNQHKIDFGKLKTWAGRPEWPVKCDACTDGYSATCDRCDGSGFTNAKDEDCHSCDGEGKYECKACRGVGDIGGDSRPAILFDIAVDINLLAKYIEHVDGDTIDLHTAGKRDHVILQGQNWIVSIMPMHVDYGSSMPEFNMEVI